MLAHRERRRFTREEYLAIEDRADTKSEYYRGELYAMTGGSMEHNQLVRNLTVAFDGALRGSSCQVFVADLRLYLAEHDLFTYPDLFVACGPPQLLPGRRDTLTDATVIVEVLSPSTEQYDRGEKFVVYKSLPSLREYLLVSQDRKLVERHTLKSGGCWLSTPLSSGSVELVSLGVTLSLEEIYRGVDPR